MSDKEKPQGTSKVKSLIAALSNNNSDNGEKKKMFTKPSRRASLNGVFDGSSRSDGKRSSTLYQSDGSSDNQMNGRMNAPVNASSDQQGSELIRQKTPRRASTSSIQQSDSQRTLISSMSDEHSGTTVTASSDPGDVVGRSYLSHLKQKRATNSYMPNKLYSNSNMDDSDHSGSQQQLDPNNAGEEGKDGGFKMNLRSRAENQKQLDVQLGTMRKYDENTSGVGTTLEGLKESFATKMKNLKPKPGRIQRRSSISSVSSQYTLNSVHSSAVSGNDTDESMNLDELQILEQELSNPRRRPSIVNSNAPNAGAEDSQSSLVLNQSGRSSNNLPLANVDANETELQRKLKTKTDPMVESLVWFSFHTPRTVLEDLITHEIDLWRKENQEGVKEKSPHTTRKAKLTSKGLLPAIGSSHRGDDDEGSDGSLSSLSDDGNGATEENFNPNFSETIMRVQRANVARPMIALPKAVERECALLFVDMSGFTKLSTMLDVESLSKVINSYFDMIVSEVLQFGGDILKFAGDAFFAEWKLVNENSGADSGKQQTPFSELGKSLVDFDKWDSDGIPPISKCVLHAAKCAISIVEKFSDFHVTSSGVTDAMLNVHCGIGMGHLVGLHVGDYKEGQEEEGVELRREFLILGDPIDQVAKAEEVANPGQVMISPEAMEQLACCCDMLFSGKSNQPICIANKQTSYINFDSTVEAVFQKENEVAVQPYESLRMHCRGLTAAALARLHVQMALYVHPVIRADELALSAAIQAGKVVQPTETVEGRHRAEAELRSVFTFFVKAVMSPKVTGVADVDEDLFKKLADIMHVTSRELDRYSGHLRQFIVDDKGVVLIATFGLRGSTFPNMVSNNGLPAIFAIHRALKTELGVENRIGATFGKVYCGFVGGIYRHEFAVMGAPVNLAARLMGSKVNNGILVDEAVQRQADGRFVFQSLTPVKAKGYDKPVPIFEPEDAVKVPKKKKSAFPFTGRKEEKRVIIAAATAILEDPQGAQSSMVFLMGESGMGKTALALAVMDDIKNSPIGKTRKIVTARSTSTETEQRIPLSSYRKIFLSIVHDLCEQEDKEDNDATSIGSGDTRSVTSRGSKGRLATKGLMRRARRQEGSDRIPANSSKASLGEDLSKAENQNGQKGTQKGTSDADEEILNKSLREISADLATSLSMSSTRGASRDQLPLSLSTKSAHNDLLSKRKKIEKASLHRSSTSTSRRQSMSRSVRGSMHSVMRLSQRKFARDDMSTGGSVDTRSHTGTVDGTGVPYFAKLCWVCERLGYPYEYADIVGSQFLLLEGANPITEVDGHVPTMDELVEFLALAFICLSDFADMIVVFVDDFQWVDSFSWKIFRVLCKRGKKMLMLCAMRSHDKQALRRLSTAAQREGEIQNQMIEISMVPLDFSEIQLLMAIVLGYLKKVIPESLCTDVFQRTGGLPVYVVQMLENMKRKKTVELGKDGMLQWTAAGLKEKRAASSSQTGAVMEETFLSRFDGLEVRVRKVLQTCAVLGLSFALSDVIQVHPEMEEGDIENALETAVDELILIEQIQDDDDDLGDTVSVGSNGTKSESSKTQTIDQSHSSIGGFGTLADRFFQFSHAMWRKNVLTTMLKERKIELHRLIAESMEKSEVTILEDADISRLLTLFDHWKSCGDFCKSAPLALTVGARLEEWDLCAQSLELYEDALEMSFDSVNVAEHSEDEEWVSVSAKPSVLDLILRLHVHVGLCHKKLGDDQESITTFEDAYKIMRTASKVPKSSKSLMIPIISSLCVLQMSQTAFDTKTKAKQEKLLERFLSEATTSKSSIHIGRAMCMQAVHHARYGELREACRLIEKLQKVYNVELCSRSMRKEYGRDYVIEGLAESVQWYYLLEDHERAEEQADLVVEKYLPLLDPLDIDACMGVILPIVQVFRLTNRPDDADWLLKRHIINPSHEHTASSKFWAPLFNPLAYVIELIVMEESESFDDDKILEMERWSLAQAAAGFPKEMERKAHTLIGEICWRLANYRDEGDEIRTKLEEAAKTLLEPIARYPHGEFFLKKTAQALMEAF